jgi:hypothetical protein
MAIPIPPYQQRLLMEAAKKVVEVYFSGDPCRLADEFSADMIALRSILQAIDDKAKQSEH